LPPVRWRRCVLKPEQVRQVASERAALKTVTERPQDAIRRHLKEKRDEIARLLPPHMTIDRLEHLMLAALKEEPSLLNCAAWDEGLDSSVVAACQAAIVGLEPGRQLDLAYISAVKTERGYLAKFETTYKGDIAILYRAKAIRSIRAEVVYEKDRFDIDLASNRPPVHKPFLGKDRGDAIGAYAVAHLANGDILTEWMPRDELDRAMSKSRYAAKGFGSWVEWWGEMTKKSVLRRQSKRLPIPPEVQIIMAQDQSSEYAPPPDPEATLGIVGEAIDVDAVKPAGEQAQPNTRIAPKADDRPRGKPEAPKPSPKPEAKVAPAAPPVKPEPAVKPTEGPKISAAQATLLRHHIVAANLTAERAAGILKAKAGKAEIEDLTVPEFKEVLAEVRRAAS